MKLCQLEVTNTFTDSNEAGNDGKLKTSEEKENNAATRPPRRLINLDELRVVCDES